MESRQWTRCERLITAVLYMAFAFVAADAFQPRISKQPKSDVVWGGNISITCSSPNETVLTGEWLELKKNSVVKKRVENQKTLSFSLAKVTFEDEGQYRCCYGFAQSPNPFCSPVRVTVTVSLQAPSISASPPDGQRRPTSPIQVTRGYSFTISCSTGGHYPEGRFYLLFSGSNRSTAAISVNRSASFPFPESQYEHQGDYSCVYEVTAPGRSYRSPNSSAITVTVKQPLLPVILSVVGVSLLLLILIGLFFFIRRRRRSRRHVIENAALNSTPTLTPMTALNEYKESDDEEEADYVNVSSSKRCSESEEEADYVNVNMPGDENTLDIFGDDDNIYQNC